VRENRSGFSATILQLPVERPALQDFAQLFRELGVCEGYYHIWARCRFRYFTKRSREPGSARSTLSCWLSTADCKLWCPAHRDGYCTSTGRRATGVQIFQHVYNIFDFSWLLVI